MNEADRENVIDWQRFGRHTPEAEGFTPSVVYKGLFIGPQLPISDEPPF